MIEWGEEEHGETPSWAEINLVRGPSLPSRSTVRQARIVDGSRPSGFQDAHFFLFRQSLEGASCVFPPKKKSKKKTQCTCVCKSLTGGELARSSLTCSLTSQYYYIVQYSPSLSHKPEKKAACTAGARALTFVAVPCTHTLVPARVLTIQCGTYASCTCYHEFRLPLSDWREPARGGGPKGKTRTACDC